VERTGAADAGAISHALVARNFVDVPDFTICGMVILAGIMLIGVEFVIE